MSKFFKRALGLADVGGAVAAGVAYYLKKEDNSDDFLDEFDDDFATEDSDSSEREYVPLNTAPKAEAEEDKTKEDKTEEAVTPSEGEMPRILKRLLKLKQRKKKRNNSKHKNAAGDIILIPDSIFFIFSHPVYPSRLLLISLLPP